MICRNALLNMENAGGLSSDKKQELKAELESRGLAGVVITATENARSRAKANCAWRVNTHTTG